MITVCPVCQSSSIETRSPGNRNETAHDWVCLDCDHTFDEPDERDAKHSRDGGSALKAKLLNADPDDI